MIQAIAGNQQVPVGRRGHRLGSAAQPAAGSVPPEVQHPRAVRDLCRPHRREQGLPGALRVRSRHIRPRRCGAAVARPDRQLDAADSAASRASGTSASSTTATSSTPWRPSELLDHAVVLREPVDGGARGMGARKAGARQREMRRAEGPVASAAMPGSITTTRTEFVETLRAHRAEPVAERDAWAGTAASSSASTTTGRSSSGSIST